MCDTIAEAKIVFTEEFRRAIQRRVWLIITALVPAILLFLLIAVPVVRSLAGDDDEPAPIGYVDVSGELVDFGPPDSSSSAPPDLIRFPDRETGLAALISDDSEIEHLFVVAEDFLETGNVEWLSTKSGGRSNRNRFSSFLTLSLIADRLDPSLLNRVVAGADYERVRVDEDGSVAPEDDALNQFLIPALFTALLMFSILIGASALLESVSEEKENRMVEVLLTSVAPLSLMAGKILALGTASLVQIIVWIASIAIIGPQIIDQIPDATKLEIDPLNLAYTWLFFLAGYFLFSVILAGVGSATTSAKEAGPITAMITIPLGIPLWFSNVILNDPEGGVARVLSFIPITAPTTMMLRIGSGDVSNAETLVSLVVTLAAGVAMLFASSRVFRAGMLLYGQRMTLRSVDRAVRQAG